jgi:hypothetical protein
MFNEIKIHRRTEREAIQAITDNEKRGYILSYPLTEIKSNSTSTGAYNYRKGRYTSIEASVSSVWYARMKRVSS